MLTFPTSGPCPQTWDLTDDQIGVWQGIYPALDVDQECRMAWAWVDANVSRRKRPKGMPRFLVSWLNRAVRDQKAARRVGAMPTYHAWECPHVERHWNRGECQNATILGRPERKAEAAS